jgi:hypothetical protein
MFLSSVLFSNATHSCHDIPSVMNDSRDVLANRGASHAEASANSEGVTLNTSTERVIREPAHADHIQVPRSPQLLSLRVDGSNVGIHDKNNHGAAYVETLESDSDTSADARRPEPHSASTFTDLPSLPAPVSNAREQPAELDKPRSFVENSQSSRTEPNSENSQDSSHTLSVNGNGVDILPPLKSEQSTNGSVSPVRSPKHHASLSGIDTKFAPGHKRTASGDIKPISAQLITPQSYDVDGASRRRSKSTGSPAHGSRIAQVYLSTKRAFKYFFNALIVVCSHSNAIIVCGSQDRKIPTITNQFSARTTWTRQSIFSRLANYKWLWITTQFKPDISFPLQFKHLDTSTFPVSSPISVGALVPWETPCYS